MKIEYYNYVLFGISFLSVVIVGLIFFIYDKYYADKPNTEYTSRVTYLLFYILF